MMLHSLSGRGSSFSSMCSHVRSMHSIRPLISRPRLGYKASIPQANSSCTKAAAGTAPRTNSSAPGSDSAASLVWGLQPVDTPRIHVVTTANMAVTEVVPLQVEQLHPDLLTKPTFTEFLAKNLISRAAKRQGVLALVLSAPYLPSQLHYMDDLAGKQSVDMEVYFNSSTGLHAVFTTVEAQEQDSSTSLQSALETALGALQPLSDVQLCLAEGVEQKLQQQLRLWDRAIWAGVLQQKLESNNRVGNCLVVRSLMGAPALQAAQQLVEKKGLHWVEVQEQHVQALVGSAVSSYSSSSTAAGSSRRRRKGSTSVVPTSDPTESSRVEAGQQGATNSGRSLIVISVAELSAKDAVQVAAYELYGRSVDGCGAEVEKAEPADKPLPAGLPRIIWPFTS